MSTTEDKRAVRLPRFKLRFLLPTYWPTWLMVGFLYALSWLPYRLQLAMGKAVGRLLMKVAPKRVKVARRTLALSFPDMPEDEREQLLKENFKNAGIALFETGIAWWWPDWRLKRKITLEGWEHVQKNLDQGRGTFVLLFHFLNLEVHARSVGLFEPSVGLYRPHNNPLMEYLQTKGRSRSNKYMVDRKDVRGMIGALKDGEIAGYLPDQDYGPRRSVFAPLFDVEDACTTTGTSIFANVKNATTMISVLQRLPKGRGYRLIFYPPEQAIPSGDSFQDACNVNKEVERAVAIQPELYMWMHRRYKTRPAPDLPSYYHNLS
ncbi:LpxL/LpxP family Kdo(2)-lipid IV(A) lauroyl/palmitoleoyl acyltransferase [Aliidiomarina soli]|uniref:Lipid A biosynthesis acyltransferase n=1 Tax=Aliidiomarina soli TaxID=1928574 RepID=A0A432WDA8_9GAMM|nr:LpxL/LpxP family Kdo(2)-lipid IV(A) lauroyl/palmitoleoyl acyltransferase [Aliidiomarina soli]RUO30373.1 lipid A biosynthesis lauroyl acyltransferase [Aliidiomarina soli]